MFKIPSSSNFEPKSPLDLFNHLKKVETLRYQQGETLKRYMEYEEKKDISIEMPAGSGKTLVGGYIAGYENLKNQKRTVYACATRQLANQTKELLDTYGIDNVLLVDSSKKFEDISKTKYNRSKSVAITTYSHIFNSHPFFNDAEVIIFDDAHATEYAITSLWTVSIKKYSQETHEIYKDMYEMIKDFLTKSVQDKIEYSRYSQNMEAIDIVPHNLWIQISDNIRSYLDSVVEDTSLWYSWGKIREFFDMCQIYVSDKEIIVKPTYYPNERHAAFKNATKRIYMTATVGVNGDLERIFGVRDIQKISEFSDGLSRVSGRRLLLFPEDTFGKDEVENVIKTTLELQNRILVLTSSEDQVSQASKWVEEYLPKYRIFKKEDIEETLDNFKECSKAVLILANRYEGIDLKDDECRLQVLYGFPTSIGSTELFLQNKLNANAVLNDKIATRLTQALGRCTRSSNDYAAVMIIGDEIRKYIFKKEFTNKLPAELQAELELSLEQFEFFTDLEKWSASINGFFEQGSEWKQAEDYLQQKTRELSSIQSENTSVIDYLSELDFQYNLIDRQYEKAHKNVEDILLSLSKQSNLNGYRAWWNYNKSVIYNLQNNKTKSEEYLKNSIKASSNKNWINLDYSYGEEIDSVYTESEEEQIDTILSMLENYTSRMSKFNKKMKNINDRIDRGTSSEFEKALAEFGELLGYRTESPVGKAVPDGIWQFANYWIVFEAKNARNNKKKSMGLDDIEQPSRHVKWLEANENINENDEIISMMLDSSSMFIEKELSTYAEGVFFKDVVQIHQLFLKMQSIYLETINKLERTNKDEAKLYLYSEMKANHMLNLDLIAYFKTDRLTDLVK